jgi:Dolichyl-phosphate-mannose-protein mannosyltransferase
VGSNGQGGIEAALRRYRRAVERHDVAAVASLWATAAPEASERSDLPPALLPGIRVDLKPRAPRSARQRTRTDAQTVLSLGNSGWAFALERSEAGLGALVLYHFVCLAGSWLLTARIETDASGPDAASSSTRQGAAPVGPAAGGGSESLRQELVSQFHHSHAGGDVPAVSSRWMKVPWAYEAQVAVVASDDARPEIAVIDHKGFDEIEHAHQVLWSRPAGAPPEVTGSQCWVLGDSAWAVVVEVRTHDPNSPGGYVCYQLLRQPETGWRVAARVDLRPQPAVPGDEPRDATPEVAASPLESASAAPAEGQPGRPADPLRRFVARCHLILVLGTALLPAWFVFEDRWLRVAHVGAAWQGAWRQVPFLSQLALPPYFAVVLLCFAGTAALVLFGPGPRRDSILEGGPQRWTGGGSRLAATPLNLRAGRWLIAASAAVGAVTALGSVTRGGLPSWSLVIAITGFALGWLWRSAWFAQTPRMWETLRFRALPLVVAHVGLVALIYGASSPHESYVPFAAFGAAGLAGALYAVRHGAWSWPYATVNLALLLYSLHIGGWWFSSIGDEYSFYRYAREIAERQTLEFIGSRLFWGQAVYGTHPYLSSVIQAVFMKVFDVHNFGWRFSGLYLSALSIGLFYYFFTTFVPPRVALVTSALLAASHYIMSFGKIGYNNLQALAAMGLALSASSLAVRSGSSAAFAATGLAVGLCFYVYPAALYVVPLPLLLLALYRPPLRRARVARWATLLGATLLVIWPLFVQADYWRTKVPGTIFYNPQLVANTTRASFHTVSNLVYALFSYLYVPEESHFVVVSYVDVLTAVFVPVGLWWYARRAVHSRWAAFVMLGFASLLFLVGASHDRQVPSTTRMFLVLPWFMLFAGTGLLWTRDRLTVTGLSSRAATGLTAVTVLGIIALNVWQAYPLSQFRQGRYHSTEALLLRVLQGAAALPGEQPGSIVVLNDPGRLHIESMREGMDIYSIRFPPSGLVEVVAADSAAVERARAVIADPRTAVLIHPALDAGLRQSLERAVASYGKRSCSMRTAAGEERFKLWYAPQLDPPCR